MGGTEEKRGGNGKKGGGRGGGGGTDGVNTLVRVCRWDSKTPTLFKITFSCILQLYSSLDTKPKPYPIPAIL